MQAWDEFLHLQEKELGGETVNKWLRPLKVLRFDACNLYLEASDSFQAVWFEEHVRPIVLQQLTNQNQKKIKVHLSIAQSHEERKPRVAVKPRKLLGPHTSAFSLGWDHLTPHAKFSNFIVSSGNMLAYKLLCELTSYNEKEKKVPNHATPTVSFNPIYIYGDKGVGKTHLLMATAHALQQGGSKVIYVHAETFTEHVVSAIRAGEMQVFRKAYRQIDVLLIDDIEVFSRKGATQEEFFHTFNTLHVEGKQIVMTAACPPQELKSIEPRLISRFEWGIVLHLEELKKEETKQLLLNRADALQFPLQDKVIDYLLTTFTSSTKALNQALEALVLRTHLNQNAGRPPLLPLSLEVAQSYLADLLKQEEQTSVTPQRIIQNVASFYGIKVDDILGKSQSQECTVPRQIAMYLCRNHLNMPFTKIGDYFTRDHSTVMASVKNIQRSIESQDKKVLDVLSGVAKQLKSSNA